MDRKEYNQCVGGHLKGKKLNKEERKVAFCVASKICSGKASTEDEARAICLQVKQAKRLEVTQPRQPAQAEPVPKANPMHPDECQPEAFFEAAKQYPGLFINVYQQDTDCEPCTQMRRKILDADLPYPIVDVPGDVCSEIADRLAVEMYPTLVLLKRGKPKAKWTGDTEMIIRKMLDSK